MKIVAVMLSIVFLNITCTNQSPKQEKSADETSPLSNKEVDKSEILPELGNYLKDIESGFSEIPQERKEQLKKLALHVKTKSTSNEPSNLIFICTYNSRRSHMSQLWAQTAAFYYGIENVHCFSGGTEATAFNPRTVKALRNAGFEILQTDSTANPTYLVQYAKNVKPVKGFSKKYTDSINPKENFAAIMTCSNADNACPFVEGATLRVAIPYDDPKIADDTPQEEAKYNERCRQIAVEMFYLFSQV